MNDKQPSSLRIAAIIPCYNTRQLIGGVVAKARKFVDEIVVVDDGSSDGTGEAAKAAGAIVISHSRNIGKGAAMKTAVRNVSADIIVFLDGDGQHDAADIPKLVLPLLEGKADFIIGSRYLSQSRTISPPFIRKFTNGVASWIISFIISFLLPCIKLVNRIIHGNKAEIANQTAPITIRSSGMSIPSKLYVAGYPVREYRIVKGTIKWITDCTGGFRAMSRANWQVLNLLADGFQIEAEMIYEEARKGFIIAETPIGCNWEGNLSKLSVVRDGFKTLVLLARRIIGDTFRQGI